LAPQISLNLRKICSQWDHQNGADSLEECQYDNKSVTVKIVTMVKKQSITLAKEKYNQM
jgi:hypothetical protein